MTLCVCSAPGCPRLTAMSLCGEHRRDSARNHHGVSRQARGYDRMYELDREQLLGKPCALRLDGCTGASDTAQHTDDGRLVPACSHCNFADGARRARDVGGRGVENFATTGLARTAWQPSDRSDGFKGFGLIAIHGYVRGGKWVPV